ncbi:MAG TPA: MraY family glycosyltransferase [Vicinamibacteria bacterium]|nr:MraY family glycosyltransferase [Vicinamibacteria bacterium]
MTTALIPIGVLVAAFVLSAALVPGAGWVARRFGVIDGPGPRKVHQAPTPRMGGIAVWAAFTLVVLAGYVGAPFLSRLPWVETHLAGPLAMLQEAHRVEGKLVAMLAGGALAFAVGLLDDVLGARFPVGVKLAGQVLAAVVLVAGGIRTDILRFDVLNVALTLVWVVGITNAFNLLDNMDGLSAGVAFVASLVLLLNAWLLGEFFISLVLVALMGSLLGFLVYNWHPASIFLGDCGSLFIGFALAALTLLQRYVSHASSTLFPVLMPVLVLALPILDTATVTFIRLREGRPIYVGDSRHLSHRLVSLGMRPPLAVFTIYLITLGIGLGAVGLAHADLVHALLILVQALAVAAVVLILLFYERRAQPRQEGS